MPFDDKKFYALATKGDLAGVAIKTSRALSRIYIALYQVKTGQDVEGKSFDDTLEQISEIARELDQVFDDLTGWTE